MTLITAHSGCDNTKDNSIEFLDYAFGQAVDCLEADVRKDGNGRLILSHDGTEDDAPFLETAFEMLKIHPEKLLNCDLKEKNLEFPVLELAKKYEVEYQIIYSGEVNPELIRKYNNRLEPVKVFLNIENLFPEVYGEQAENSSFSEGFWIRVKTALEDAALYGIQCINVDYHLWKEPFSQYVKGNELECSLWTVNEKEDLKLLLETGVYNITTRAAALAIKTREEAAGR